MDKRLPLALLLSLLFLWVYISLTAPPPTPGEGVAGGAPATASGTGGPGVPGTPGGAGGAGGPGGGAPDAGAPSGTNAAPAAAGGAAAEPEPIAAEPSRPVPFDGQGFRAEFETGGAALSWLELTDYHTEPDNQVHLRLIGSQDDGARNFVLRDLNRRYPLDRVTWDVREGTTAEGRRELAFTWTAPDGLRFVRTVRETGAPFTFELDLQIANTGTGDPGHVITLVQQGPHGLVGDAHHSPFDSGPTGLAVVAKGADRSVQKWSGGALKDGAPRSVGDSETLLAAGSMSNYFTALLVPRDRAFVSQVEPEAVLDPVQLGLAVAKKNPASPEEERAWHESLRAEHMTNAAVNLVFAIAAPAPGQSATFAFTVYAGPKDRVLAEQPGYAFLQPILEDSFGRMAWINHALLAILRFFERLTSNWGFAIILLTLLVRLLLFPMNRVQQSSMAKYSAAMQRLKPQIDALKARHKGNTRKFNEEQMKLLRAEGVSPPLGGCLLMFVQFPIWISLFQILRTSIELRHAPWIGWVHDLSRPDRMPLGLFGFDTLNLLPILMAVATLAQMRFQPKPADESQAQMQKIMGVMMPVMMLFILYAYPSGLSLYIFTSSVFGIIEYQAIRRFWPPPGSPQAAAAAARAEARVRT